MQSKKGLTDEDYKVYKSIIEDAVNKDLALTSIQKEWLKSLEERVQPMQELSEGDENMIKRIKEYLNIAIGDLSNKLNRRIVTIGNSEYSSMMFDITECISWLEVRFKSLKDKVYPKQEWSEEDEKRMNHIIQFLEDKDRWKDSERAFPIEEDIRWLKDLRPQNRWQPSDEQMDALDNFIYAKYPNVEKYEAAVKSLYKDLKKLRGE